MHGKFRGAWEDYRTSVLNKHKKLNEIEEISHEMSFYAGAIVFTGIARSCDSTEIRALREEIEGFMLGIRERAAELGVTLPPRTKH